MGKQSKVTLHPSFEIGEISPRLFGAFLEPIGTMVNGVMYNPKQHMEYTALANVYDQYYKTLILGFENPETLIPEYIQALKDAGLEAYMAAKTEAFKEWCTEKGITYVG